MARDPTRDFADEEIESCLSSYGGWMGWFGEFPGCATRALAWKASQGDESPKELDPLRDAIAQFGHAPIEEAVTRVQGLERAFAEIDELMEQPGGDARPEHLDQIREIVRMCVKFSGDFGDEEEAEDA